MNNPNEALFENESSYRPLSNAEKLVYAAVTEGNYHPFEDITAIAKQCNLSEIQTEVALQLLTYKALIPQP